MTLVIGMVWGDGVLVVGDNRVVDGSTAHSERKVMPIYAVDGSENIGLAIVSGAGDGALVKQGFEVVSSAFTRHYKERPRPDTKLLSDDELGIVLSDVQSRITDMLSQLRSKYVPYDLSLMIATVTMEGPRLYVVDGRGIIEPVHEDPGYAVLGIGRESAQLLLRLLGFNKRDSVNWDLGLLGMFIVNMVSKVNPYVSPVEEPGDVMYIRRDGDSVSIGMLSPSEFMRMSRRVEDRAALLSLVWRALEHLGDGGEKKVAKYLRRLVGGAQ